MEALRCPPGDASVENLSGGEVRRVALCQLLLRQPDLLLLDEPTNHLDAETIAWLERHLREYPGSVLMITHDRYFLDNVTGWIWSSIVAAAFPMKAIIPLILNKSWRMAQENREEASRQRAIAREQEWILSSPKARQTKSKARIKAYDELRKAAADIRPGDGQIVIPASERLGNTVINAEGLTKGYGDRLLIDDLEFNPPGGIVGIIDANGAGKSTLFRMITDQESQTQAQSRLVNGSTFPMWTKAVMRWMAIRPCGKRFLAVMILSNSVAMK